MNAMRLAPTGLRMAAWCGGRWKAPWRRTHGARGLDQADKARHERVVPDARTQVSCGPARTAKPGGGGLR